MKRIIHNAGCGSFCTESFCCHPLKAEKTHFNVVYDCGSSDMGLEVQQEALSYFSHYGYIDLLFISHLDEDHVNGIKALRHFMDRETKVFLPFFEDSYRLLSVKGYFAYYFDLVDYLSQNEIPIIFIDAESNNDENDPVRIDDLNYRGHYPSGTVFYIDRPYCIWEYIPFNIQESVNINLVEKVCYEKGMTNEDFDRCINHKSVNDSVLEKLKQVYKDKRISKIYSGVTEANMSSMLLISKNSRKCDVSFCEVLEGWHTDINSSRINLKYTTEDYFLNNASCLYTGDAGLRKDECFDIVLKYYRKHLPNGVGIMQIPHHGTAHYYPKNLFNLINMKMAFVNITLSSSNPLFYAQIPFDFANKHIPLYIVDKEPYSRIMCLCRPFV